MYCASDADKNKQQLEEFLFGISMTQKTKDREQATSSRLPNSQLAMK